MNQLDDHGNEHAEDCALILHRGAPAARCDCEASDGAEPPAEVEPVRPAPAKRRVKEVTLTGEAAQALADWVAASQLVAEARGHLEAAQRELEAASEQLTRAVAKAKR